MITVPKTVALRAAKSTGVMSSEEEKNIFSNSVKQLLNAPQECSAPGCKQPAINSHVLQRRKILESIATAGCVMERTPSMPFSPRRLTRKSIRTSDVLAFVGFCSQCDKKLFQSVEDDDIDFNNYWHQMLLLYRAHVCAVRKADAWHEAYNKMLERNDISKEFRKECEYKSSVYLLKAFINEHHSYLICRDLFEPKFDSSTYKPAFTFYTWTLPAYIEFAASSCFNMRVPYDIADIKKIMHQSPYAETVDGLIPNYYCINLLPINGVSYFSLGYISGVKDIEGIPVEQFPALLNSQVYQLISNILLRHIETWCISVSTYNKLQKENYVNLINAYMQLSLMLHGEETIKLSTINIFDALIRFV